MRKLCLTLSLLLFVSCAPTSITSIDQNAVGPSESQLAQTHQNAVLEQVNELREKEGLEPLKLNAKLTAAAQKHAENMISTGQFEHEIDGKKVQDRLEAEKYEWVRAGENLASGQTKPDEVVQSWMDSEAHRSNILKADFTEMGLGFALDEENNNLSYWVQVFASPAN